MQTQIVLPWGWPRQPGQFFYQGRSVTHGPSASSPRVGRKEGVHVISDAIAKFMANGPHTIQPGDKVVPAFAG